MSTAAARPRQLGRLVAAAPARSVVPALARQEARRLLLHPLSLVGFALFLVAAGTTMAVDYGPRSAYETVAMVMTMYPGVLLILVGHLVASRDLRAESIEMLEPAPARREERVLALGLASVAPALVGLVLNLALHTFNVLAGRYADQPGSVPGAWQLLAPPITLLGACLLGLMLATWSPARVTAVVGLVVMVLLNSWLDTAGGLRVLGMAFGWVIWGDWPEQWAGLYPGSPILHVGYLLGLCGMAFSAAWLRVAARRAAPFALGMATLAVAVGAGMGQFP